MPTKADRLEVLQMCADKKLIFDAHCHYFNYRQESEGLTALTSAMGKNGVGYAALTGCPFKKTWVGEIDSKPPVHHLYDDGDLYYYSATDGNLWRHLVQQKNTLGKASIAGVHMLACGMNLGDYSCGDESADILENYPEVKGFGEIVLQSDDINNVTVKGGNWTYTTPSVKKIIKTCAAQKPKPLPFVFYSDARSVTTKPYRAAFEYLDEIAMVCSVDPSVPCLWCGAGVFARGQWGKRARVANAAPRPLATGALPARRTAHCAAHRSHGACCCLQTSTQRRSST